MTLEESDGNSSSDEETVKGGLEEFSDDDSDTEYEQVGKDSSLQRNKKKKKKRGFSAGSDDEEMETPRQSVRNAQEVVRNLIATATDKGPRDEMGIPKALINNTGLSTTTSGVTAATLALKDITDATASAFFAKRSEAVLPNGIPVSSNVLEAVHAAFAKKPDASGTMNIAHITPDGKKVTMAPSTFEHLHTEMEVNPHLMARNMEPGTGKYSYLGDTVRGWADTHKSIESESSLFSGNASPVAIACHLKPHHGRYEGGLHKMAETLIPLPNKSPNAPAASNKGILTQINETLKTLRRRIARTTGEAAGIAASAPGEILAATHDVTNSAAHASRKTSNDMIPLKAAAIHASVGEGKTIAFTPAKISEAAIGSGLTTQFAQKLSEEVKARAIGELAEWGLHGYPMQEVKLSTDLSMGADSGRGTQVGMVFIPSTKMTVKNPFTGQNDVIDPTSHIFSGVVMRSGKGHDVFEVRTARTPIYNRATQILSGEQLSFRGQGENPATGIITVSRSPKDLVGAMVQD
jgi:hypothetical protein